MLEQLKQLSIRRTASMAGDFSPSPRRIRCDERKDDRDNSLQYYREYDRSNWYDTRYEGNRDVRDTNSARSATVSEKPKKGNIP